MVNRGSAEAACRETLEIWNWRGCALRLTVATWNINSVRLRIDLVTRFLREHAPDVLCLQETKCRGRANFRSGSFQGSAMSIVAINGQKGYHGVAIVSRLPFDRSTRRGFCGKGDAATSAVTFGDRRGIERRSRCIISMCRPAATSPIPRSIRNSPTSSPSSTKWRALDAAGKIAGAPRSSSAISMSRRSKPTSGATRRFSTSSPTRRSKCEKLRARADAGGWVDAMRALRAGAEEKLYTWWSYRAPTGPPPTAAAGSIISGSAKASRPRLAGMQIIRDGRGWERPSDHVPVLAHFEL